MKTFILLLMFSLFILSGCTKQGTTPSLEELGMISVLAFDYIDNESMKMTAIMPQPAAESEKHTQLFTVETDLVQKGLVDISSKADKTASLKQLRVILFSEEFAKKGEMKRLVQDLYRNTDVRSNTYLGIVKDSAEEVLSTEYKDKQNLSSYINNVFQPKQYTYFTPFIAVHDFINDQTNPLISAIVPYLELKENLINIEGIAVFNDGKMIHVFTPQEGSIIQILRGQKRLSILAVTLDQNSNEKLTFESIKSKSKITSNRNINAPKIKIEVTFKGKLSEYVGEKDLSDIKEIEKLEKEVSKKMEGEIREFIKMSQELSSDPVGFFESFRMRYKGDWQTDLTRELLAIAEFDVKVETHIWTTGILK